jgi:hypothetical protein
MKVRSTLTKSATVLVVGGLYGFTGAPASAGCGAPINGTPGNDDLQGTSGADCI